MGNELPLAPISDHPLWMEAVERANSDICVTLLFSNDLKITEMASKIKALAMYEMLLCWAGDTVGMQGG